MKPHLDIEHEGTLDDERTRMTFDENSVAHLMSILTDLYSNPALAVIREYSTNGLDSHVAAGQTRPIEVELPSRLRPMFVVRDFGTGMTVDQITNQFAKYGWSSKRDSDTAVGMLGLGCKSGLSYTSQFTLVSVHDGVQVTVLVTREDDGAGAVHIIDTAATEKPNGVEVQIPVKEPGSFNAKAKDFFKFWEAGQVLVNGAEPELIGAEEGVIRLADDVLLVPERGYQAESCIVMGNVPYPFENKLRGRGYVSVIRVPIGAVDFTPSREALHRTKRTDAVVLEISRRVNELVIAKVQAEIDAASTAGEAAKVRDQWHTLVPNFRGFVFKGEQVPSYVKTLLPIVIPFRCAEEQRVLSLHVARSPDKTVTPADKSNQQGQSVELKGALAGLHVIGHRGNGVMAGTKRKLARYIEDNGLIGPNAYESVTVYLYAEAFGSPWLDDAKRVSFAEIQAIDLGDATPTVARSKWRVVGRHGQYQDVDALPPVETTVWFCPDDNFNKQGLRDALRALGLTGLALHNGQVNGFKKNHPEYLHVTDWVTAQLAKVTIKPADVVLDRRRHSGTKVVWLDRLPVAPLVDPELVAVLTTLRAGNPEAKRRLDNLVTLRRITRSRAQKVDTSELEASIARMIRRYPVLGTTVWMPDFKEGQVIEIVNTLYAARKRNPRY